MMNFYKIVYTLEKALQRYDMEFTIEGKLYMLQN